MFYRIVFSVFALLALSASAFAQEKYCRYEIMGGVHYGEVQGENILQLDGAPWEGGEETGHIVPLDKVRLLHPSEPRAIIGLYASYRDGWVDNPQEMPKSVRWFLKPPHAAASPGEAIVLPPVVEEINVEVELVVVVGKALKNATPEEAKEAIFGYTVGNDIIGNAESFHRLQEEPADREETVLLTMLKMGDNFAPYGPFIHRGVDWRDRARTLEVNNPDTGKKIAYRNTTSGLGYPPEKALSDISKVLTLSPGDVVFTGTTAAPAAEAGDVVTVSVEGLGTLINPVKASE